MMKYKRLIAIIISCSLWASACMPSNNKAETISNPDSTVVETITTIESLPAKTDSERIKETETVIVETDDFEETTNVPEFSDLSDQKLLQYVKDRIYSDLEKNFSSDDYIVEDIQATYISQEYLDELAYNSKSNIYFGYTLEEIENQYNGTKFIFTLGEDGNTVVEPFEEYDDTFDQVIQNVSIGSGVILVCVTVSVVSGGLGVPAVSLIFATAAKTGTLYALSSGVISAATTAAVTGFQTNDPEKTFKSALLKGSESFKWAAIFGSIMGGVGEAITWKNKISSVGDAIIYTGDKADDVIPTARQAELLALDKYPGTEQVSFFDGKEVSWGTPGATRPDIVRIVDDHIEAIEVKNYNLVNDSNGLYYVLKKQISERIMNLPPGSTQRIVLNVQGRGYTQEFVNEIINNIQSQLMDIYPNIPVDVMGAML